MFVLTQWAGGPSGKEPAFPVEPDGFQVLLDDGTRLVVHVRHDEREPFEAMQVPPEVAVLLESALSYIPAMARARSHFMDDVKCASDQMFLDRAHTVLTDELTRQPIDNAVLVRSIVNESGYRDAGEYVWALALNAEGTKLTWASSDAEIYVDPVETFDLPDIARRHLVSG